MSERERGVLGYLKGSLSRESRPLRTEHSERERTRPDEWMLLTPIMVGQSLQGLRERCTGDAAPHGGVLQVFVRKKEEESKEAPPLQVRKKNSDDGWREN